MHTNYTILYELIKCIGQLLLLLSQLLVQCFVASIISQASFPRPGLVKEAIVHAVELQHGDFSASCKEAALSPLTLSAVWVGIVILSCTKSA